MLADDLGVSVDTVRYYERRGLLPEPPRTEAGYRSYTDEDRRTLAFILRAKEHGFTLKEIAGLLAHVGEGMTTPRPRCGPPRRPSSKPCTSSGASSTRSSPGSSGCSGCATTGTRRTARRSSTTPAGLDPGPWSRPYRPAMTTLHCRPRAHRRDLRRADRLRRGAGRRRLLGDLVRTCVPMAEALATVAEEQAGRMLAGRSTSTTRSTWPAATACRACRRSSSSGTASRSRRIVGARGAARLREDLSEYLDWS